ncbi:MAG TPA: GAF domain-containing protein [Aequorivita sp.]|nr:GAF domain-containing protein [Aequorivita sp.]
MSFTHLKPKIKTILANDTELPMQRLTEICELLQSSIGYYDWVGFYFANEEEKTLHLKAFAGEPTDHIIIPFGKGICGQVAISNKNFVVPDVKAQDNYIACSIYVKSEIVIPLFKDGENIGQIDIDSHSVDPFSTEDERFLEWVNEEVATIL